jgi:hypothetical protein
MHPARAGFAPSPGGHAGGGTIGDAPGRKRSNTLTEFPEMADITAHSTNAAPRTGFRAVLHAIADFFENAAASNRRVRQVQYLQSLTDEELAQRGLKRENIVHHVFSDLYYV